MWCHNTLFLIVIHKRRVSSGSKFFTLHSSLFTSRQRLSSSSPLGGLLLPAPPWLSPPSVMSSSPDAAAAACGSTFCQLTSSENWRLNLRLRCNPVGSWRWLRSASRRLPRWAHESPGLRCPSRSTGGDVGIDGHEVVAQLTAEAFQPVTLHGLHELRHATLAVDGSTLLPSKLVKRERAVGDGYGIEGMSSDSGILLGIILNFCHFLSVFMGFLLVRLLGISRTSLGGRWRCRRL